MFANGAFCLTAAAAVLSGWRRRSPKILGGPHLWKRNCVDALAALGEELESGALDGLHCQYARGTREGLDRSGSDQREALGSGWNLELGRSVRPGPLARDPPPGGASSNIAPGNMAGLPAFTPGGPLNGNVNAVSSHGGKGLPWPYLELTSWKRLTLFIRLRLPSGDNASAEADRACRRDCHLGRRRARLRPAQSWPLPAQTD